jgi:hypothetical protein
MSLGLDPNFLHETLDELRKASQDYTQSRDLQGLQVSNISVVVHKVLVGAPQITDGTK